MRLIGPKRWKPSCARKLKSHIHRKGKRGKPLTEQAGRANRTKSTVRIRVEHIFGAQANNTGGTLVRTIGLVRAKAKIGMKNLLWWPPVVQEVSDSACV